MARRSTRSNKGRRVVSSNANDPLLPFLMDDIPIVQDRRVFHPDSIYSAPLTFYSTPAKVRVRSKPRVYQHSFKKSLRTLSQSFLSEGFDDPNKVLVCVRRNSRKEVLHALGKAGRRGQRKPRRNYLSNVKC